MTINELIKLCDFSSVKERLCFYYGEKDLDKYEKLYNDLKIMAPSANNKEKMCIFITAFYEIEGGDEDAVVENYDENDRELYFDVSAYDEEDNEGIIYSIAATRYADFLLYTVDKKTLNKMSPESILAHSLYEITAYGFEDNV